ncbi:MAG: uroporphyrinogen decarboxylase family protein [Christensenellales bacterium]|jgi:hypothetical protein
MNISDREHLTLGFTNKGFDRGMVQETLYPWDTAVERWEKEGLKSDFSKNLKKPEIDTVLMYIHRGREYRPEELYYNTMMATTVHDLNRELGFDPIMRMAFRVPFVSFEEKILEDTNEYYIRYDRDGWTRKYYKHSELVEIIRPVLQNEEDWEKLKERATQQLEKYCTKENVEKMYGPFREGCKNGDFSIRFRLTGFFWASRDLFGVEGQFYAFYDYPDIIHDINQFIADTYLKQMDMILDVITPGVLFFEEDLSGKNGPMISAEVFNEFVAKYYKQVVPFFRSKGVREIFVDTDGDFKSLIPHFIHAGIDSFLPFDVNAGMDIFEIRALYPKLKIIGGFNKLCIEQGPAAIDQEFERLLPIIKQGGYMPGCDHQPTPDTTLESYRYYIKKLTEVMTQYRGENAIDHQLD